MNGIQRCLKRHLNFILSLALTALCLTIVVLVYDIRYEANDDAMICNIASGAYGADSQYLVYVNILIEYLMKLLTRLQTTRNWFFLMCLAVGGVSITLLGRLLLDKAGRKAGLAVFSLLLLYIGVPFFAMFHYARYASLIAVAGIALVWMSLGKRNGDVLLVCFGSMLRLNNTWWPAASRPSPCPIPR